jgi:hypothetical protein
MRLVAWLAVGLAIYFGYGYWNSRLHHNGDQQGRGVDPTQVENG